MLDVFNVAAPQNCNIQTFYGTGTTGLTGAAAYQNKRAWNKPRGVSNVYILLIGAGGTGTTAAVGGGSGAVTVWYGAAGNVPDTLYVDVGTGTGGNNSFVYVKEGNGTFVAILTANAGAAGATTAGSATPSNFFAASGFYSSVAGQAGVTGAQAASTTTFLSGGATSSNSLTANYGYTLTGNSASGFSVLSPIIVSLGGNAGGSDAAGIGSGGGAGTGNATRGGPGFCLIASW